MSCDHQDKEREWDESDARREVEEIELKKRMEREQIERARADEEKKKRDEEEAKRSQEERHRREMELAEKHKHENEIKARKDAEAQAKRDARDRAIREAEERARAENEERSRREASVKAQREAEIKAIEQARLEDERRAAANAPNYADMAPTKLTLSAKRQPTKNVSSTVFSKSADDEATKRRRLLDSEADAGYADQLLEAESSGAPIKLEGSGVDLRDLVKLIPHTRDEILSSSIEYELLPNIDERLRAWLKKKLKELIGNGSDALVEMIMMKLRDRCTAKDLISRLTDVLDEDTEPFVLKMWRMVLFEMARYKAEHD